MSSLVLSIDKLHWIVKLGFSTLISWHLTQYKYLLSLTLQECTAFELGVVAIGTHKPPCLQMKISVVAFDG